MPNTSPDGSRSKIKELKALLKIADCPNCDGSGAYMHNDGSTAAEIVQCQFCHERTEALKE